MTLSAETASTRPVAASTVDVISTGAALGAEIRSVDLRDLNEAAFVRVMQAWQDHSVLLFRDQKLSDHELIAFSRRLGDLDWAPIQETGRRFVEGLPEIYIVSNVKVNGEPIGSLGDGEAAGSLPSGGCGIGHRSRCDTLRRRTNSAPCLGEPGPVHDIPG